MAMTVHVDIVSAEGEIFSGLAEMVYAHGVMGELGIAPRHTPLITRLKPGEVRIDQGSGEMRHFYVSGGILEIQPHVITILADTAIRARDLDEAAAEEAKRRAEEALSGQHADFEYAKAQAELAEAIAQLRAIERLRKAKNN
ncbi:MAG: F0F1 ATP synthase subunit epsilon [Chromatiaceae bacterium]|nr:F0F1 ATP synthase subunit epsilon [Gammaproteobacteria bacterium]MCP5428034.1 F0F1 ATP synthase subunit epsilon [Chromatiaceae bacterium]MCB1861514.1 F0F1 ATP synthase subunit epsilon [Gammaproteobacteria bacterium]MCB1872516.1 F0F1 ATP synthase subunit epsilon [Gammaproteobacteria bacterium]MCB1880405.1 F0F1 ATP synthase subunit epsilon [Gammaproteobacteria bacterium]